MEERSTVNLVALLPRMRLKRRPSLEVRTVGDKGLGVLAAEEIPEGTMVIKYWGRPRWIWEIPKWEWDHLFQVDYDKYLAPRTGSYGWSINHSCEPNCAVRGAVELTSLRRIAIGEELTFDYSTSVGWDGYQMQCRCGSPRCRGVITSYARLSEEWKARYRGMVSPFLLRPPVKVTPTLF